MQPLKPRLRIEDIRIDEDMTPLDTDIDYKVSLFLYLHNDFLYNLLGSTCTCLYFIEGTILFQSASSSKSNIRFVGSPTMLFTLGTLAQVGACLKDIDNTFGMAQDVLHLGHHLRRPVRAPQPRWRPKPIRPHFSFGLQE